MTSRLKRKLNDLGVDPASAKANESFCLIGTPLPPLEKSKDTGEFVPLWKQEVRDEKGRRRLHGAFTGGFSAGYFNTVGSKEGWTPSTFVSSRSDRAKQRAVRPEDFMDEEDLAELQESRKLVDEHDEMDFGGTEAELRSRAGAGAYEESSSVASALEASLAPAPKDSVGARILKKMGWRLAQGIGPRLTYTQRKAQDEGVLDSWKQTVGDEEHEEEAKKHLYPRRDTPVLLAPRKDNFHGLGYVPGMRLHEAVGQEEARGKGPSLAAGFGLGALNDVDEDDLDVYDSATGKHGRTRMAYDEALGDEEHHFAIGSRSRGRTKEPRVTNVASVQTFNDGRPVLKGFVLSERPVSEDRWFPLPEVPKGWTSNPRRVWEKGNHDENVDTSSAVKHPPRTHGEWKSSFISADQRGSMLGETPLPSQPRSVFEYMSQKDRERLQNIRNTISAPSTATTAPAPAAPPPTEHVRGQLDIPNLHPSVAKAALQGFQPFTTDPVKQSRYTTFLNFQANREPGDAGAAPLGMGPTPGQSIDGFNKELADYAKAAIVFKPLSAAMAGRFRSAVIMEHGPKIIEGLHKPDFTSVKEEEGEEEENEEKEKKGEDPRMGAVRLGMYGPLTRDVQPWQPARLLCKRFGVKEPEVDMGNAEANTSATADFAPTAAAKQQDVSPETPGAGPSAATAGMIMDGSSSDEKKRTGPRDLANVGLGEDDDQGRDTLTYQRPAMDIFKAIFASDDEESEAEGGDEAIEEQDVTPVNLVEAPVKSEPVPAHLLLKDTAAVSYDTQQDGTTSEPAAQEKVDLASFKPTFVPRSERQSRTEKSKSKDKKDKEKKKKASKALMSFDVEDGMEPNLAAPEARRHKDKEKEKDHDKDRERKKKRRKEHKEEDVDEGMWVEKPPPEAIKNLVIEMPPLPPPDDSTAAADGRQAGPPRGRKRAIDFM